MLDAISSDHSAESRTESHAPPAEKLSFHHRGMGRRSLVVLLVQSGKVGMMPPSNRNTHTHRNYFLKDEIQKIILAEIKCYRNVLLEEIAKLLVHQNRNFVLCERLILLYDYVEQDFDFGRITNNFEISVKRTFRSAVFWLSSF